MSKSADCQQQANSHPDHQQVPTRQIKRRVQPNRGAKKLKCHLCQPHDHLADGCDQSEFEMAADDLTLPSTEPESDTSQDVFYTHEADPVLICDRFLLGKCRSGLKCTRHHTPGPYYWQLRVQTTKMWIPLGPKAQEQLERNYCNANTDRVTLEDSDGLSCEVNLKTLRLCLGKYDRIRRLRNSGSPRVNPYFPAQWRFYWKGPGFWKDYEESISVQLNKAYKQRVLNDYFEVNGNVYKVDLKHLKQYNVRTKFCREMRRRPVYRSYQSMAPYLKTGIKLGHGSIPDTLVYQDPFPSEWLMQPRSLDAAFLKLPLDPAEAEYMKIETDFHQTLPENQALIYAIHRIQNKFLWQKYTCQKEFMSQGLSSADITSLEKHLYHGTTQDSVDQICQQNFDPRVSGLNGTAYGKGSYFALEASYAHKFSKSAEKGLRYMLLAKVLVGKMALGKSSYSRPPALSDSYALYDSCVDDLLNPKIFVVFDSCQCYPLFLIEYKLISEPILVTE
ncbi:protein mono-ADP-ribosyltransferase TIPARP-like [Lissotriton helveticus]